MWGPSFSSLVRELNGSECDGFKPEPEGSKATAVTRQFGVPVTELDELCEAMVQRAARGRENPSPRAGKRRG